MTTALNDNRVNHDNHEKNDNHWEILKVLERDIAEFTQIRHEIHQHPELAFKEIQTSRLIAEYLQNLGYDVATKIGKTGVVASLKKGNSNQSIGIRADMDALPILEETGLAYASKNPGVMHACGHDGHVTVALAAAKALAEAGDFNGTVRFIFQPAEEIGLGAKRMIDEGLFTKFPIDRIYGLHNWPALPVGKVAFVEDAAMASVDFFKIKIKGKGSHGAEPQNGIDPVTIAAYLITSLQTIVSRNVSPKEMAVLTVGSIQGGNAANVIPDEVTLQLTLRAYRESVRNVMKARLQTLVFSLTESFGAEAEIQETAGFAAVENHHEPLQFAYQTALQTLGADSIEEKFSARTASEDFSFLLAEKEGAFLFVGNGDSAALHNPKYDFNDEAIIPAAALWAGIVEQYLSESTTNHHS